MRPTRKSDTPQSFLAALREKYASDEDPDAQIVISGKVAQEMGFDKIRSQQARLHDLKVVILDGMRIASASAGRNDDDATAAQGERGSVRETCPSITQLDLSRNLFERFEPVVDVCRQLDKLRRLSVK